MNGNPLVPIFTVAILPACTAVLTPKVTASHVEHPQAIRAVPGGEALAIQSAQSIDVFRVSSTDLVRVASVSVEANRSSPVSRSRVECESTHSEAKQLVKVAASQEEVALALELSVSDGAPGCVEVRTGMEGQMDILSAKYGAAGHLKSAYETKDLGSEIRIRGHGGQWQSYSTLDRVEALSWAGGWRVLLRGPSVLVVAIGVPAPDETLPPGCKLSRGPDVEDSFACLDLTVSEKEKGLVQFVGDEIWHLAVGSGRLAAEKPGRLTIERWSAATLRSKGDPFVLDGARGRPVAAHAMSNGDAVISFKEGDDLSWINLYGVVRSGRWQVAPMVFDGTIRRTSAGDVFVERWQDHERLYQFFDEMGNLGEPFTVGGPSGAIGADSCGRDLQGSSRRPWVLERCESSLRSLVAEPR